MIRLNDHNRSKRDVGGTPAARQIHRRALIPAPRLEALQVSTRLRLIAAEALVPKINPCVIDRDRQVPTKLRQALAHPLMVKLALANAADVAPPDRTEAEKQALLRVDLSLLSEAGGFARALSGARSAMGLSYNKFRSVDVGYNDGSSKTILYPQARLVAGRMELVRLLLVDTRGEKPNALLNAMAVLGLTLNAHPYPDGNGRTARMLFNLALQGAGLPFDQYVPLSRIILLSPGGFVSLIREVEILGRWDRLVHSLCGVIEALTE